MGQRPKRLLFGEYLKVAADPGVGLDFVAGIVLPLVGVWVLVTALLATGVQKALVKPAPF